MATRLLINNATPYAGPRGGIARYLRHIARAATAHYGPGVIICSPDRIAPPPSRWIRVPRFRGSGTLHVDDLFASAVSRISAPQLFFSGYFGAARTTAPEVFTVYDCIHEIYRPGDGPRLRRELAERRRCLERAAAVIAISHNTAHDILRFYPGVDPSRIIVTHLGASRRFFDVPAAAAPSRPYFLFVGNREGHKNFGRLAEAFAATSLSSEFELRVISPDRGFTGEEREHLERLGIAGSVIFAEAPDDSALAASYAAATAFVYPSEYEGFGLPVLEAMAAGTLVATSNSSSLPEAGGDTAFYFDPLSVEAIATAMTKIARLDPAVRRERVLAGIDRARTFPWERCERQTLDLFDAVIERRPLKP